METQVALERECNTSGAVLNIAFELSNKKWKLLASDGRRKRAKTIDARDLIALSRVIADFKTKLRLDGDVEIRTCFEAGRDGFWLHRWLSEAGIKNLVVDAGSIEMPQRRRRKKTDRLDVEKLLQLLMRYHAGDRKVWSVCRVPSKQAEDDRRLHRELGRLKKERTGHNNRIRSLLITQGIDLKLKRGFLAKLEEVRLWDGSQLQSGLKEEIIREYERFGLIKEQILLLERKRKELIENGGTRGTRLAAQLLMLRGIGINGAWLLSMEFFAWRKFSNRREVGASAGLTGTPYSSGDSQREQGISKAGSNRIRAMLAELAWGWLRFQPDSKLSLWYKERYAGGGSRMRRVGIVAVARKLLIALWRFVEQGIIPEGAVLKTLP